MATINDLITNISSVPTTGDEKMNKWAYLKNGIDELGIEAHELVIVYGESYLEKIDNHINSYGFYIKHGRAFPIAEAIKCVNSKLSVIVICEYMDLLGEGLSHFITICRNNPNVTVLLYDDSIYSTEVKQTELEQHSIDIKFNPLALAITQGATFAARGITADMGSLTKTIVEAIRHNGFSLVSILQSSNTANIGRTYPWYRERIYQLNESGYRSDDQIEAYKKSLEWGDKIPVGILYKDLNVSQQDSVSQFKVDFSTDQDISSIDITKTIEEFI